MSEETKTYVFGNDGNSMAPLLAAMNNGGFGGNGAWWPLIFLFALWGGNGGWGGGARSAIGQRKDGTILFLVVESNSIRTTGAGMEDLEQIKKYLQKYIFNIKSNHLLIDSLSNSFLSKGISGV